MATPQPMPIIIHKAFIGLVLINIVGVALLGVLVYAALTAGLMAEQPLGILYGIAAFLVALGTLVEGYVYRLSYVEITDTALVVVNYSTLFVATSASTEYTDIQDVDFG